MDEQEFKEQLQAMHERVLSKAMSKDEEDSYTESLFESIRHVNEYGQEFWYARELQIALEYKRWDKFLNVIEKAKTACENSGNSISDHFSHVGKEVHKTIGRLGGTMPENLPTPEKSIKQLERELKNKY